MDGFSPIAALGTILTNITEWVLNTTSPIDLCSSISLFSRCSEVNVLWRREIEKEQTKIRINIGGIDSKVMSTLPAEGQPNLTGR